VISINAQVLACKAAYEYTKTGKSYFLVPQDIYKYGLQ